MEEVDVVVIGAGFAGLSAAKTYLQCAPETNLVVLDAYGSPGGVWSQQRIYPGLRSNNLLGTFEFPSFPMTKEYGVEKGEYIPGQSLRHYLRAYAKNFGFLDRIRQNSKVTRARKGDGGACEWVLDVNLQPEGKQSQQYQIGCKKLIVATGLTSQPETLNLPGQEAFNAPIIHFIDLPKFSEGLQPGRNVSVCGGSKGAHDTVHLLATSGLHVNWIIRESGYGATWMAPSYVDVGPFKQCWIEKLTTRRLLSWLAPCIWDINGGIHYWIRTLLHSTWLGRKFTDLFWNTLSAETLAQSGLTKHPELAPLTPKESALWFGGSLSILNYPKESPVHDLVTSGKVTIYRSDISHFSDGIIHLKNGSSVPSQSGLITNGWKHESNFVFEPASLHAELGVPSRQYSDAQKAFWHQLDERATKEVYKSLPRLRTAPRRPSADRENTTKANSLEPYRLYRFLAPPILAARGDRSIVFQGFVSNLLNVTRDEISALWCYAYLNRKLNSLDGPHRKDVDFQYQAALTSKFCSLRFPYGFGHRFPDFVFELVPYLDNLVKDLGLPWKRKKSWSDEIVSAYGPEDYKDLTNEWLRKQDLDKKTL